MALQCSYVAAMFVAVMPSSAAVDTAAVEITVGLNVTNVGRSSVPFLDSSSVSTPSVLAV